MRLYGKRFMANRTEDRIANRKESRDAIVYDISEVLRYCRVRVAGSDVLVRAWFPNNFMRSPQWLKVGAAVRVSHVGGDKSRIEVVSPGLVQPTPATMPMSGGANTILLGMMLSAPVEGTGWTVEISEGTYRINGVSYAFSADGPNMNDPNWHMGDGGAMTGDYWWGSVDPIANDDPDELWFRYDAFVIGNDGVVDYLKGDEWQYVVSYSTDVSGPVKPDIPTGHVLIRDYILVSSGTTAISQANIGMEWTTPRPWELRVDYAYVGPSYPTADAYNDRKHAGIGVLWGGQDIYEPANPGLPEPPHNPLRGGTVEDMTCAATITVLDQYGVPYSYWTAGSVNEIEIQMLGSATVDGQGTLVLHQFPLDAIEVPALIDDSGYGPKVRANFYTMASIGMTYTRQHDVVEVLDSHTDGYPEYRVGKAESHTTIFSAKLISEDANRELMAVLNFYDLDSGGEYQ